ncbi:MAG: type II secretion system minor pseudopilin GspI, partial [Deltaproteobacteria bacterium]|nr:type II secretion system minor pseudopilin GspI [Deltaproteobacteria bacterium]
MNLPVFRRAGENGFTLLEVLISLAILSGVIVTILTVMNSHIAASERLSERAFAALLARESVEEALLSGAREGRRTEAAGLRG